MTPQVTPQVTSQLEAIARRLGDREIELLRRATIPGTIGELMQAAGLSDRKHFRSRYIQTLLDAELLEMTEPESPSSPTQQYVATDKGRTILEIRRDA